MKKIINFLVRKSSFTFYKRTLALVLAFVMLFNLSGEAFSAVLNATTLKNIFSKEEEKLKTVLREIAPSQEEEKVCSGSVKDRYECAYENFAKVAQDYEDLIKAYSTYINLSEFYMTRTGEEKAREESFKKALSEFEEKSEEVDVHFQQYLDMYDEYNEWQIRRAKLEAIHKAEQEQIRVLKEEEATELQKAPKRKVEGLKKEYEKRYEKLSRNNEKTFNELREGIEFWKVYEEEWKDLNEEFGEYNKKLEALKEQVGPYLKDTEKIESDIKPWREAYYVKVKEVLGLEITENTRQEDIDLKLEEFGKKFDAWKAEYEKERKAYTAQVIKEYDEKAKKFTEAIKERALKECTSEGERQTYLNTSTGDSWKDWKRKREAFSAEKDLHRKCFGAPALSMDDFDGGKFGFSFAEYEEIKYKEYKDKYVKAEEGQIYTVKDKNGEKKTKYKIGKEYAKIYGNREAEEIAALFLLNDDLGIQALGNLKSEEHVARALQNSYYELSIEAEDYADYEEEDFQYIEGNNSQGEKVKIDVTKVYNKDDAYISWHLREMEKAKHAKIAEEYIKEIDRKTSETHNHMFAYVERIKQEAYKRLWNYYFPYIISLSGKRTPDEIAEIMFIDLNKYRKEIRGTADFETLVKQEKYNHFYTREEIREAVNQLEKPRLEVLDWVFIAFPSTWIDYASRKNQYYEKRMGIWESEGAHSAALLKDLLKVQVQYFPDEKTWNAVAEAAYKSKAKGLLDYMLQLANYVQEEELRDELKHEPYIKRKQLDIDFNANHVGAIVVGLVADMVMFVGIAKVVQLAAKGIVTIRTLKALTPESRMMYKAMQNIIKKNPEMFTRYQKALKEANKLAKMEKLSPENIKALARSRKEVFKFEKEVFKRAEMLSEKSWQKKYQKLSKTFSSLSKDSETISQYISKYNPEMEGKLLNEIEVYNKLVPEYNETLAKITKDPEWVKYNEELGEYYQSLKIVSNEKGEATLVSGRKMPAKTKRVRQIDQKIAKRPELSKEAQEYIATSRKAGNAQENLNKFNEGLGQGKKAKKSYTNKVKAKQEAPYFDYDKNKVNSYKAPTEEDAMAELNREARAAEKVEENVRKFNLLEDLQIRMALSETWQALKEGTLGIGKLFITPKAWPGLATSLSIDAEAGLLPQTLIETTIPLSENGIGVMNGARTSGVSLSKVKPINFNGVNVRGLNGNLIDLTRTGKPNNLLLNFNGIEGYDKRWYWTLGLSKGKKAPKPVNVLNLRAIWWNKATTVAYNADMLAMKQKVLNRLTQESISMIWENKALPAQASAIEKKVYKEVQEKSMIAEKELSLYTIAKMNFPELSKEQIGEYIKAGEVMFQAGQKPVASVTHPITMVAYQKAAEDAIKTKIADELQTHAMSKFNLPRRHFAAAAMMVVPIPLDLIMNLDRPRMSKAKQESLRIIINEAIDAELNALGINAEIDEEALKEKVAARVNTQIQNSNTFTGRQKKYISESLSYIFGNAFAKEAGTKTATKTANYNLNQQSFFNKQSFLESLRNRAFKFKLDRKILASKANKLFAKVKTETNKQFNAEAKKAIKEGTTLLTTKDYDALLTKNFWEAVKQDAYLSKYEMELAEAISANAPQAVSQESISIKLENPQGEVMDENFTINIEFADKKAAKQWENMGVGSDETLMVVKTQNGTYELVFAKSDGKKRGIYQPFIRDGKNAFETTYLRLIGDLAANPEIAKTLTVRFYSDTAFELATYWSGITEGLGGLPQATVAPEATALGIEDKQTLQANVTHSQLGNVASTVFTSLQKTLGLKNTLAIGLVGSIVGLLVCAGALTLPTIVAKIAGLATGSFILGIFTNGAVKPTNSVFIKENSNDADSGTSRAGFANAGASIGTMMGYLFFPLSVLFALTGVQAFFWLYAAAAVVPAFALINLLSSDVVNLSEISSQTKGLAGELKALGKRFIRIGPNLFHNLVFTLSGGYKERVGEMKRKKDLKQHRSEYNKVFEEQAAQTATATETKNIKPEKKSSFMKSIKDFFGIKTPAALSQYIFRMMLLVALYHFAGMAFNSGPGAIIGEYVKGDGSFLVDAMRNSPISSVAFGGTIGFFAVKLIKKLLPTMKKDIKILKNLAKYSPLIGAAAMAAIAYNLNLTSELDSTAVAQILTFFTAYLGVYIGRKSLSNLVKKGFLTPQGVIGGSGLLSTIATGLALFPGLPIGVRMALWGVAGFGFANLAGYENALAIDKYPGEKPAVTMAYTLARISGALTGYYGVFANWLEKSGMFNLSGIDASIYALSLPFATLLAATLLNGKFIGTFAKEFERIISNPVSLEGIQFERKKQLDKDAEQKIKRTQEELVDVIVEEMFKNKKHSLSRLEKEIARLQYELDRYNLRDAVFEKLKTMKSTAPAGAQELSYELLMDAEIQALVDMAAKKKISLASLAETAPDIVAPRIANHYNITPEALSKIEARIEASNQMIQSDIRMTVLKRIYQKELTTEAERLAVKFASKPEEYNKVISILKQKATQILGDEYEWVAPSLK